MSEGASVAAAPGRVFVFGSANRDHVLSVDAFPGPGQTVLSRHYTNGLGGKGANQAIAAAQAGAAVVFVGALGRDESAEEVLANFASHGINTHWVSRSDEQPTGLAVVLVDAAGGNQIVVAPGANGTLSEAAVDAALTEVGPADVIVVQCEIPAPSVERVVRRGAGRGACVVLNLAPYTPLQHEVLGSVGILVVNETEARAVSGSSSGATELARDVASTVGRPCVVTLGEHGSVHAAPGVPPTIIPAVAADRVVDTTGAGDVYVGTLAAYVARGDDIDAAMGAASAAAARSVASRGAQTRRPEPTVDAVG